MENEKMPSVATAPEQAAAALQGVEKAEVNDDGRAASRDVLQAEKPVAHAKANGTNGSNGAVAGIADGKLALRDIRREARVRTYITKANEQMAAIGFTEHGHRHAGIVASIARSILNLLDYTPRQGELAAIAGYLHDIGCVVNRHGHVEAGALISFQILSSLGMEPDEIADVVGAIGNHEEPYGLPISPLAAAVIIADKSDVHYSRVQNPDPTNYDIHDKVNGAVRKSFLRVEPDNKTIRLELEIDTEAASIMEYFEIFITRMVLCRRSAQTLGCQFRLSINGRDL
jgi:hypothetical protein